MGHVFVETPHARYCVIFQKHGIQNHEGKIVPLPDIPFDAFVTEGVYKDKRDLWASFGRGYEKEIASRSSQQRTPVFMGDVSSRSAYTSIGLQLSVFFAVGLHRPIQLPLIPAISQSLAIQRLKRKGEVDPQTFEKLSRVLEFSNNLIVGKGASAIRDALIAQKSEEVIAPLLRKKLGKKPVIAIVYGTAHAGIVHMLRNPAKRRRALARMSIRTRKESQTRDVTELRFYDLHKNWSERIKFHNEDGKMFMPPFKSAARRGLARLRLGRMKIKKAFH